MKKPRNILIAAVCLVLVTAIAAGCTFAGKQITEPEHTVPTATEPTPSTYVTEPITSTPPASDPPSSSTAAQTLSAEEAQALAYSEELIDQYKLYKAVGVCCEFEPVHQDMSQFLTADQKEEYYDFQYRLNCCHSIQEVSAHIDRYFAPSVQLRGYPNDLLFTDDQGNLYLIVTPTEYDGYCHIKLEECTTDRIIASACIYDEDGCWCSETFTIKRKGNAFTITQIVRNDTVHVD